MRTIILGIGNEIVKDDGVGIFVAHLLKIVNKNKDVDIETTNSAGIYILDFIEGYDRAVLIDSIKTEGGEPGNIYEINVRNWNSKEISNSVHTVDVINALTFYKKHDTRLPDEILLYAVEIGDASGFGEQLTPEVRKSAYTLYIKLKKELSL